MTDLGLPPGATGAVALDLNGSRQAVGFFDGSGGAGGAFLWDPVHGSQVLPSPTGSSNPYASAIDESGVIVGSFQPAGQQIEHCAAWQPPAPPPSSTTTTTPPTTASTPPPEPVMVRPAFTG